ncbi:T9SS type A sorting domain-containing protein [Sabulibacter ruber]|uniref:Ig-like domain-containing protein n=1 Tax=Sabulibacter ruber TaxID=2811901 RepID=UPI001A971016|nr:T9SS type A sorting domain-containing protein [Sabulibacter ruber]
MLNPIKERATTITGTSTINGTGTVYVYIDGTRIAGTATVSSNGSTAAQWSISITSANQLNLAAGVQVTASILPSTPTGTCESQQTAPQIVSCYAPSSSPVISTTSQTICRGNVATVTISGVENGVAYQLFNGETATGPSAVGDTTSANTTLILTSGALTSTTALKVRAYRIGSTACTVTLNGSAVVTVNPGPTAFNVTPTNLSICNGGTATVSLSGSEAGVSYRIQVYDANTDTYVNSGNAVAGTGSAITLTTAALSTTGTFKVVATSSSCTVDMGNTFTVFVPSNTLTLSPATRSICSGSTASVTIRSSQTGVTYQLFNGTTASGSAVAGNGGDITLTSAALTTAGTTTFRVVATTSNPACSVDLSQTFAVTVTSALTTPTIALTSSNPVCDGGTASIRVTNSLLGVTYQIYNGNYTSGSSAVGTGGDIVLTSAGLTASTTLTVRASNSCGNSLTSAGVAVTVNTIQAYTISPTSTTICSSGTVTLTLANSSPNTTYTLKYYDRVTRTFVDFNPVVSRVNGSGASGALTFPTPTLSANATLKIVATSGGCSKDMLNTVDVVVSSTAVTFSTSTQTICSGSAATVSILNSQYGAVYQLQTVTGTGPTYTNTGTSVIGTGGDITLTSAVFNANGTNTLRVLVTPSNCPAFGSSTFPVTVASPTAQTVTRDTPASICSGSTTTLSLATSELGVTYQIYANNEAIGLPVQGTGGKISLTTSPLTASTTLKVVASKSGCGNVDMTNTYLITVGTPSTVYTVSPASNSICANGTAQVTLSGSQSGVYYQLYNGNTATGAQVLGNGNAITLMSGVLTSNATLTVVALSSSACGNVTMDGFSAVTVAPQPLKPTLTANASSICSGGSVTFTVGNLVNGVTYQLYKDGVAQGSPLTYNGFNTISFTATGLTASATFTIRASSGTCTAVNSDASTVTVSPTPLSATISTTVAAICGSGNATISATGNLVNNVSYRLFRNGVAEGNPITYNGSNSVSFEVSVSATAKFTIVASSASCPSATSNEVTVTVNPAPTAPAITTSNSGICGSTPVTISVTSPVNGYSYQLFFNGNPSGSPVVAIGQVTFTASVAGTYRVRATSNSCESPLSNEVSITSTPEFTANAGPDKVFCSTNVQGSKTVSLEATTAPTGTTGNWTVVSQPTGSGTPVFADASNPTTTVSGLNSGDYIFRWTVSSTSCGSKSDEVTITMECEAVIVSSMEPKPVTDYQDGEVLFTFGDNDAPITSYSIVGDYSIPGVSYKLEGGQLKMYVSNRSLLKSEVYSPTINTTDANGGSSTLTPNVIIGTPLPVTLTSFRATATNNGVQLNWTTASEKDNDYFQVERSLNGKTFASIGRVQGNGNSNVMKNYTFTDASAPAGAVYYRLKQVDYDGKFEYSKTISVNATASKAAAQVAVVPNPFTQNLSFSINSSETRKVQVVLLDLNQKLIYREEVEVSAGKVTLTKDLSKIANGVYLLKVTGSSLSEVIRVVKKD